MPKVTVSNRVAARPDMLWQSIGGFGAIADWHPMIEKSEADGKEKGSMRTLHLVGGGKLIERLETVSERERTYTYAIVDGPLPVKDYRAEIKVTDNGDGSSTVEWTGSFEPASGDASAVTKTVEDIYRAGLENIQKLYGMRS